MDLLLGGEDICNINWKIMDMTRKICKNCKFWMPDSIPPFKGYSYCLQIDGDGVFGRDDIILDDSYDGRYLWTGENFGCIKFLEKNENRPQN